MLLIFPVILVVLVEVLVASDCFSFWELVFFFSGCLGRWVELWSLCLWCRIVKMEFLDKCAKERMRKRWISKLVELSYLTPTYKVSWPNTPLSFCSSLTNRETTMCWLCYLCWGTFTLDPIGGMPTFRVLVRPKALVVILSFGVWSIPH